MKRTFVSLSQSGDGVPRSLEVSAVATGQGFRTVCRADGQAEEVQLTAAQAPGGDWLVEQGGIVRAVRMTVDRDIVWLSTLAGTPPGSATTRFQRVEAARSRHGHGEAQIRSPMTGRVVQVAVEAGQTVAKGQVLVVVEAMKMEHALKAPAAGVVAKLLCQVGQQVEGGVELVELTAAD